MQVLSEVAEPLLVDQAANASTPASRGKPPIGWSIDPRLLVAVLGALLYHGVLSIYGTYRNTYDAYVHIFFADHWSRSWFDHWDPR